MDSAVRKHTPSFKPTGLHLKCEEGPDSNPVGPLYYTYGDQYEPVYVNTTLPQIIADGTFSSAWLSLREARKVATIENLPLEVF
jgi:hypothetical protein